MMDLKRLSCFWVAILMFFPMLNAWGYTDEDCIGCHTQGSDRSTLTIPVEAYLTSIHANEIECVDCHKGATSEDHTEISGSGKVDCEGCHEQEGRHGKDTRFPCYQCHTRHEIFSVTDTRASVYWKNLEETCGGCHPQESETEMGLALLPSVYIVSHPKQDMAETFDKGMCVGCHQGQAAHGEQSPVNEQTCYQCHLPLGKHDALLGYIHTRAQWDAQPVSLVAGYTYLAALVIFVFFAGFAILKRRP